MRGSNYEIMKKDAQMLFLNYDQQRMITKFSLVHDTDYLYLEFVSRRYRICRRTGAVEWLGASAAEIPDLSEFPGLPEIPGPSLPETPGLHSIDKAGQTGPLSRMEQCLQPDGNGGNEILRSVPAQTISDGIWHEAGFEEVLSILDVLCYARDGCCLSGNYCSISNVKGASLAAAPGNDMFAPSARVFDHQTARLAAACEALGGTKGTVGDVSYTLPVFPFLSIQLQFWESDDEFPPCLKFMWDENILQYMHFETTFYVTGHVISRLKDLL